MNPVKNAKIREANEFVKQDGHHAATVSLFVCSIGSASELANFCQ